MKIINLTNACDDRVTKLQQQVRTMRKSLKKMLIEDNEQNFRAHCMIQEIYNTFNNRIGVEYILYTAKLCAYKDHDNSTIAKLMRKIDVLVTLAVINYRYALTAIEDISTAYQTASHEVTVTLAEVIKLAHAIKRNLNQ